MNIVYLSIGTNIGDRYVNLQHAVKLLKSKPSIEVSKISSIYETVAVGYTDQANFLNIAVEIKTTLNAFEVLAVCQSIENDLGRVREFHWGPRIIDLDILLYNHENIEAENLIVPHAQMFHRAFVLIPLVEIAPARNNAHLQKAHIEREKMDSQKEGVMLWKTSVGVDEFVHSEN